MAEKDHLVCRFFIELVLLLWYDKMHTKESATFWEATIVYCHNCGEELKDNAKFCHNCGQRIDNFTSDYTDEYESSSEYEEEIVPMSASIRFTRTKSGGGAAVPIKIYIDGMLVGKVGYGRDTVISVEPGSHSLRLELNAGTKGGQDTIYVSPDEPSGYYVFRIAGLDCHTEVVDTNLRRGAAQVPLRQAKRGYVEPRQQQNSGRTCPKCGGLMTIQAVTESRKSGCGTILLYVLLALTIFGLLIVIPLTLRKKTETVTYAVCQRCGHKIVISRS